MEPIYKIDVNIPPEKMLQLYGGTIENGVWTAPPVKKPEQWEYYYRRGTRHFFRTPSGNKVSFELFGKPDMLKRGANYNLTIKADFAKLKNTAIRAIKLSSN